MQSRSDLLASVWWFSLFFPLSQLIPGKVVGCLSSTATWHYSRRETTPTFPCGFVTLLYNHQANGDRNGPFSMFASIQSEAQQLCRYPVHLKFKCVEWLHHPYSQTIPAATARNRRERERAKREREKERERETDRKRDKEWYIEIERERERDKETKKEREIKRERFFFGAI